MTYIECRFWRILYETRAIGLVGTCFGTHCATDGRPVAHVTLVQANPADGFSLPKRDTETLRSMPVRLLELVSTGGKTLDDPRAWAREIDRKLTCEYSPTVFKLSRLRRFGELVERFYFSTVVPHLDACRPPPPTPWSRIAPLILIIPAPALEGSSHAAKSKVQRV